MSDVKWAEFRIGDLFDVQSWIYGKNKNYKSRLKSPTKSSIAVISGTTSDNGVNYYTEDDLDGSEIYQNCITMATRGNSGTCFYHDEKFCLANNVLVMPMPNLSREVKLFLCTAFSKLPYGDNYSHYPTKDSLENDVIQLPVTSSGDPDFSYMEKRISELEEKRISELEAYLTATGLDDYELTDEDRKILDEMKNGEKEFGEFWIGDLFKKLDLKNKKNFNKKKDVSTVQTSEFNLPLINAKHGNNGIMYYGKNSDYASEEMTVGIVNDGAISTGDVYPHPEKTGVLYNAYLIKPVFDTSSEMLMYLSCSIQKSIKERFGYDKKATWDRVQEMNIIIPITSSGTPDYEWMERYIKAMEKEVIGKLYEYRGKEIDAAKEIVNQTEK